MAAEDTEARSAEEEREEGEIADNDDGSSSAPRGALAHPLEHVWTFWFNNPQGKSRQQDWGSTIHPVHTLSTVEDFWSLYNNIHPPSKLSVRVDLHCFKNKIEPKWEDPICANGGIWTISCARGKSDTLWLHTLLALIGEQFDFGDEICGVVVSVRQRQDRVAIWTKNAANEAAQISIGKQWKEFLEYKDSIGFIAHEDAKAEKVPKNRYTV